MKRRERLENTFDGQPTDRTPVALWRHFPGDDQRSADLAKSVLHFQGSYDWDFVVTQPSSTYQAVDYGLNCVWDGAASGDRIISRPAVTRSLGWMDLRTLDPRRGEAGKVSEAVGMIARDLADDDDPVPLILVVYSPLTQAARLAGDDAMRRDMRVQPDRLRSGLNIITENTLRFIDTLKRLDLAGICYVVEHADFESLSEAEYSVFGLPYDRKLLADLPPAWWLNILRVSGGAPMLQLLRDYPVSAVQWQIARDTPDIPLGKSLIRGAVCGGISAWNLLWRESPNTVRNACREATRAANGRRLILSADGPLPIGTPQSNIRAVRQAVESI